MKAIMARSYIEILYFKKRIYEIIIITIMIIIIIIIIKTKKYV